FCQNRCSGETKKLNIGKVVDDVAMCITKLRPMAFIKDKHHPLIFNSGQAINPSPRYSMVKFLNGRNNNLYIGFVKLPYQFASVSRRADRTFAEFFVLLVGLIV